MYAVVFDIIRYKGTIKSFSFTKLAYRTSARFVLMQCQCYLKFNMGSTFSLLNKSFDIILKYFVYRLRDTIFSK